MYGPLPKENQLQIGVEVHREGEIDVELGIDMVGSAGVVVLIEEHANTSLFVQNIGAVVLYAPRGFRYNNSIKYR